MKEIIRDRELHEECGVFGIYGVPEAASLTYYGLHALQHRGQEGAGIVSVDDQGQFRRIKGCGLVTEVFNEEKLSTLKGSMAIGHVRYTTAGGGGLENIQPFLFRHNTGDFAMAHNGNIVNSSLLRTYLENKGSLFQSTSDSEILAHLIKKETRYHDRPRIYSIIDALNMLEGAFAFLIMTANRIYACRDKYGLRPLSIGRLGEGWVVASETCALDVLGAEFVRDIEPGEIVTIDQKGIRSSDYSKYKRHEMCAMEYIYFARPDSDIEGCNVHAYRKESGRLLFREAPAEADIVVGVPDSSLSAAMGYAEASGLPYEMGLIKNKYIGRTFIQPTQELREGGADETLGRAFDRAGQARGAGRRLDRAGHHLAADRGDAQGGRRPGGARAHRQPSDDRPVLLRRRHVDLRRADLGPQECRGGAPDDRRRLAGIPLAGVALPGRQPQGALYGLLHGGLSDGTVSVDGGREQGQQIEILKTINYYGSKL